MDMKRFEEAYINLHIVVEDAAKEIIEECIENLDDARELESGIYGIAADLRAASDKLYELDEIMDKLDEFYGNAWDELHEGI